MSLSAEQDHRYINSYSLNFVWKFKIVLRKVEVEWCVFIDLKYFVFLNNMVVCTCVYIPEIFCVMLVCVT